jgi:hypothetical protein
MGLMQVLKETGLDSHKNKYRHIEKQSLGTVQVRQSVTLVILP